MDNIEKRLNSFKDCAKDDNSTACAELTDNMVSFYHELTSMIQETETAANDSKKQNIKLIHQSNAIALDKVLARFTDSIK